MPFADLVLEGGGVKGSGLVGAVAALQAGDDPYVFKRYAGTSAGAIVAALLAAGYTTDELKVVMDELDFILFEDLPKAFRMTAGTKKAGSIIGLVFRRGMYRTAFMHSWIADKLKAKGVVTWADLKQDDPGSALPPEQRYRLVVMVSDVSAGKMRRIPWAFAPEYGVDPDDRLVADAVTASASIPFFFRPFSFARAKGSAMIVDGGLLSNYPIDIFDRPDPENSRWPTIGVKLSARETAVADEDNVTNSILKFAVSVLRTLLGAHDRAYISNPAFASRTVFVDTTGYSATQFDLTAADKATLYDNGRSSGEAFLRCWDWELWKKGNYAPIIAGTPRA
ncbi:patatin-like phospholipase family protein [Subtercola sp. YIM 133946]|uniref:patatin-like phospholipase family protein n=1 Tax=Subtercola sp. YIM 133946 TaxID=3118909 RepID=UPI002F9422BA